MEVENGHPKYPCDDEYLDAECGLDSGYVDSDLLVELESSDSESLDDYMSSSDDECLDISDGLVSDDGLSQVSAIALPGVDTLNKVRLLM